MCSLCALLGALWALNIAPQPALQYQTRSIVVLSNNRLEALLHQLKQFEDSSSALTAPDSVSLLSLKKAGKRSESFAISTASQDELPVLNIIEIRSNWKQPVEPKTIEAWVAKISYPVAATPQQLELERTARWLQWKLKTTAHYETTSLQIDNPDVQAVVFDSSSKNESRVTTASVQSPTSSLRDQLIQQLDSVESRLKQEKQRKQGQISLQASSAWNPVVKSAPILLPVSGLLLGALAGAVLCWLVHPRKNTSMSGLTQYQSILTAKGIPLLTIHGTSSYSPPTSTSGLFRKVGSVNRLQWWMAGCEWSLLLWGICIVGRFLTDPLWRSLAVNQPLAALANLFFSMS
jgi:hypothetical protein